MHTRQYLQPTRHAGFLFPAPRHCTQLRETLFCEAAKVASREDRSSRSSRTVASAAAAAAAALQQLSITAELHSRPERSLAETCGPHGACGMCFADYTTSSLLATMHQRTKRKDDKGFYRTRPTRRDTSATAFPSGPEHSTCAASSLASWL